MTQTTDPIHYSNLNKTFVHPSTPTFTRVFLKLALTEVEILTANDLSHGIKCALLTVKPNLEHCLTNMHKDEF